MNFGKSSDPLAVKFRESKFEVFLLEHVSCHGSMVESTSKSRELQVQKLDFIVFSFCITSAEVNNRSILPLSTLYGNFDIL